MKAADRRAITQTTGALVDHNLNGHGVVTGHYDDDFVYAQFEGDEDVIECVPVSQLTLIRKAV